MASVLVAAGIDSDGNDLVELRFAQGGGRRMKKNLREMRPVYVVGIGLHRYQRVSETSLRDARPYRSTRGAGGRGASNGARSNRLTPAPR